MPHGPAISARAIARVCVFALCALLRQPVSASDESIALAWRAPALQHQLVASESISRNVHYAMNATLMKLAGSRADPTIILEDRTQTIAGVANDPCLTIQESDARRYGGDHPKSSSVVHRVAQLAFDPDAGGHLGLLPPLNAFESAPQGNGTPSPTPQPSRSCSTATSLQASMYADVGDAALSELPPQNLKPGDSWTFSRRVRVDRELASGSMTYVDRVQRIDLRGGHHVAVLQVLGNGRMDVVPDLQQRGFHTADMTLTGSAEFDVEAGLPLQQQYAAHVEWEARILGVPIGLIVDESYSAAPWRLVLTS